MKEIRKISLYFQWDTAAGASKSFRIGTQTSSYTLDTLTDFSRVYDNFAIIQIPLAEVVSTGSGTAISDNGMGYLRANQGDPDEFVYTIISATFFTGSAASVLVRTDSTATDSVVFYPPV